MSITNMAEGIKHRTRDITYTLGDNPIASGLGQGKQGAKSNEDRQSHHDETESFHMTMLFHFTETGYRPDKSTRPYKGEQPPAPYAFFTQDREGNGRIAPGNMSIDCGMIPLPELFLQRIVVAQGMIKG